MGGYLKEYDISITKMLSRLEKKENLLTHKSLKVDGENNAISHLNITKGVAAAFELSWEKLNKDAQQLACFLSLFALAPIPWELVESIQNDTDEEELEDARIKLERLHLIQKQDSFYQLHQFSVYSFPSILQLYSFEDICSSYKQSSFISILLFQDQIICSKIFNYLMLSYQTKRLGKIECENYTK